MAPPLTLTLSCGTPSSFMKRSGTLAKPSFTSNKSICPASSPARARALRAAGAGPLSMMLGSLPTSTAAAPSTMPELLPAVCTWWMRCSCG
jgi:hypothetical protein